MDQTKTDRRYFVSIGDYEQAILDSLEDVQIMEVNALLAEGYDFYEALKIAQIVEY